MTTVVSDEAVAFWNERAADWEARSETDSFYVGRRSVVCELVARFGSGRTVLDVGCGVGLLTDMLCERGFEAFGCDVAEAMIDVAVSRGGNRDRFCAAPGGLIPFPRRFHTIVAIGVFPYVADQPFFAGHLREHLHRGGVLIASSTNRTSLYTLLLVARHLLRFRSDREWRETLRNLFATGIWSGGFLRNGARDRRTNARRFDDLLVQAGFEPLGSVDLYNVARLDRAPLERGAVARVLARIAGWTHVGVYRTAEPAVS